MLGIALMVIGGTVYLRGLSAPKGAVLRVGDVSVSASAEERSPIAPWAAGLAVLGGLALVTTGTRRKA
jgi:MYXO-CTERM domain-containing protein